METCKICGQEVTTYKEKNLCNECEFWMEVMQETSNPSQIHYTIQCSNGARKHIQGDITDALVDKSKLTRWQEHSLGFGGADWYIKDNKGIVHHYNNLWSRGEIPERFYDVFPVTAEIVLDVTHCDEMDRINFYSNPIV